MTDPSSNLGLALSQQDDTVAGGISTSVVSGSASELPLDKKNSCVHPAAFIVLQLFNKSLVC